MVGPRSDGDFAMSIGMGGGRIRKGASVVEKKKTAKPESSMKTKKKATRTKAQMSRLLKKLKKKELENWRARRRHIAESGGGQVLETGKMARRGSQKGGLTKEISKFKTNLTKQDKSDIIIVNAYKRVQKHKYSKEGKPFKKKAIAKSKDRAKWVVKKEFNYPLKETLEANFRSAQSYQQYFAGTNRSNAGRNPTVRKVIRKNKKLVKEKFKEQIKKDRVKRKLDESKKRMRRN